MKQCVVCRADAKYQCPRCRARSCSVACAKRHECGGSPRFGADLSVATDPGRPEADRIAALLAECRALDRVARRIESTARLVVAPVLRLRASRCEKSRLRGGSRLRALRRACQARGIRLALSPAAFRRHALNRSHVRGGVVYWTVEICIDGPNAHTGPGGPEGDTGPNAHTGPGGPEGSNGPGGAIRLIDHK